MRGHVGVGFAGGHVSARRAGRVLGIGSQRRGGHQRGNDEGNAEDFHE